ncbi:MerR family transcriptional regulator [Streptomyces sp. NPDC006879]|uniref:MerR family transcriptional regulator n=1 Tax=Streptomyces sp. NPDC006879 TaxID=3364767 RepID=UPI003676FF4F
MRPHETPPKAQTPAGVGLSTGAVAMRLGVAPATLRSWERRYGIGPAARVNGRHRRWLPQDIALLEEMCRLTSRGIPPAEAARAARLAAAGAPGGTPGPAGGAALRSPGGRDMLPLERARGECRGLARAAVRLDSEAVEDLLDRALSEHRCVTAWEEIIAPTLHAVGRKWATAGERYIEVEHLLSWLVSLALRGVPRRSPTRDVPPVLLAGAPGELHSLPLEALWAALGERGLPVRMFGPAVPPDALEAAVRRTGPSVVVVWAQSRTTAVPEVLSAVEDVEWGLRGARSRSRLLLAGPGWSSLPGAGSRRLTGLRSGLTLIENLLTGPGMPAGRGPAR